MKRVAKGIVCSWEWANKWSKTVVILYKSCYVITVVAALVTVYNAVTSQEFRDRQWRNWVWPIQYRASLDIYKEAFEAREKAEIAHKEGRTEKAKELFLAAQAGYQKAIAGGLPFAKYEYGRMLCSGVPNVISANTALGSRLIREAANDGDPEAKHFGTAVNPCMPGH